jgi:signal transduction histidine kinase
MTTLPSIFKPLVRLEKDIEGTGMGLSIAQKIIDIHEGKIWVESEVGIGSTFYISFSEINTLDAILNGSIDLMMLHSFYILKIPND